MASVEHPPLSGAPGRGPETTGSSTAETDPRVRVVLIGDSELITEGLRVMLSYYGDQVVVVGAVSASSAALPTGRAADVALVNVHGRHDRAQQLVAALLAVDPPVRVVIFTSDDEERRVFEALRLGVSGYLLESTDAALLADDLVRVGEGQLVIDPAIATRIATQVARGDGPSWSGAELGLSRRESEVLQRLVSGRSNRQIADEMVLGAETVKTHLRSVYRKIGVSNRAQAVATAIRKGIMTNGPFAHPLVDAESSLDSAARRTDTTAETPTPA